MLTLLNTTSASGAAELSDEDRRYYPGETRVMQIVVPPDALIDLDILTSIDKNLPFALGATVKELDGEAEEQVVQLEFSRVAAVRVVLNARSGGTAPVRVYLDQ